MKGGIEKRSKISRRSSPNISSLPDELLIKIFSRLGPESKHAFQCRSLSKHCLTILKSPTFIRQWRENNQKKEDKLAAILLAQCDLHCYAVDVSDPKGFRMFGLFDFLNEKNIDILATHKDLVLCRGSGDHSVYYICNPITKHWRALSPPPTGLSGRMNEFVHVGLMVDEDGDGDGFEFKVLRMVPCPDDHTWKVETYSSRDTSGEWRRIDRAGGWNDIAMQFECTYSRCISYDGMLVMLITDPEEFPVAAKLSGFKFDPSNAANVNGVALPLPADYEPECPCSTIGLFEGRLRLAQCTDAPPIDDENPNTILKVWELKGKSKLKWKPVHELDFNQVEGSEGSRLARSCLRGDLDIGEHWRIVMSILALDPNDGNVLYLLFGHLCPNPEMKDGCFIFSFNVSTKRVELVGGLPRMFSPHCAHGFRLEPPSWPTSLPPP